jgi:hypothetical protein
MLELKFGLFHQSCSSGILETVLQRLVATKAHHCPRHTPSRLASRYHRQLV